MYMYIPYNCKTKIVIDLTFLKASYGPSFYAVAATPGSSLQSARLHHQSFRQPFYLRRSILFDFTIPSACSL